MAAKRTDAGGQSALKVCTKKSLRFSRFFVELPFPGFFLVYSPDFFGDLADRHPDTFHHLVCPHFSAHSLSIWQDRESDCQKDGCWGAESPESARARTTDFGFSE